MNNQIIFKIFHDKNGEPEICLFFELGNLYKPLFTMSIFELKNLVKQIDDQINISDLLT